LPSSSAQLYGTSGAAFGEIGGFAMLEVLIVSLLLLVFGLLLRKN